MNSISGASFAGSGVAHLCGGAAALAGVLLLGAISVHGVVGMWGLLAVSINNDSASLGTQVIGLISIFSWVFVTSLLVWYVIKLAIGIRVDPEHEYEGIDISECGLEAYPEFAGAE